MNAHAKKIEHWNPIDSAYSAMDGKQQNRMKRKPTA